MRKLLLFIAFAVSLTSPSVALTKAEALVCVKKGVDAFLGGKPISHMIDVPYMKKREEITASDTHVRKLLDNAARENKGYYRNVSTVVVGQPQAKKGDFYLVAGTVRGEATESLETESWEKFSYQYILWIRKEEDRCLIGVLAIEEAFRLASWVKSKL